MTGTTRVLRRNARAILLQDGELVLIKRTRPGQDPYWVSVGGVVEPEDATVEQAMRREVFEEIGGSVGFAEQVYVLTEPKDEGICVHHFFLAVLADMDLQARTGTEFSKPERGGYEVQSVPFTADAMRGIRLMPPELADYLADNALGLLSLLDLEEGEAGTAASA